MAELATTDYVKKKTRREYGTVNFRGTQRARVNFKSPFTRRPRVVIQGANAINVTETGFELDMLIPHNGEIDWHALPREDEDEEDN